MPDRPANQRAIFHWITEHTPRGGRVLDIGCGDGALLAQLVQERGARGTGIEISEDCVVKAVGRGLSVHHGNAEEGMDHYSDNSFDLLIMSLAIQEMRQPLRMIREAFRVARQLLIVFPNFAHWRARCQLGISGRAPRTRSFPHNPFESPNRHFFSVADWEDLCAEQKWRPVDRAFFCTGRPVGFLPNLRAEVALYLMED